MKGNFKTKELLKKIMEQAENPEAVDLSEEGIRKAAQELGYSEAQIEELFANFEGFPLDEDDLDAITGGLTMNTLIIVNPTYAGGLGTI